MSEFIKINPDHQKEAISAASTPLEESLAKSAKSDEISVTQASAKPKEKVVFQSLVDAITKQVGAYPKPNQ